LVLAYWSGKKVITLACSLAEYGRGHKVTQREVAALLRRVHVYPRPISIGGRIRLKGYIAADLREKQIFERILGRDPYIRTLKRRKQTKRNKTRKSR
jgi:hypothetical protein